jgi:dynein intermediate chain
MSDVKWSPVHPGLFATACSNGTLGLWNLASSLDEPLTGAEGLSLLNDSLDAAAAAASESTRPDRNRGLNKIRWSGDGRRLAAASGDVVHVLTIPEDIARPKGDEDDKIMNNLVSRGLITRQ